MYTSENARHSGESLSKHSSGYIPHGLSVDVFSLGTVENVYTKLVSFCTH